MKVSSREIMLGWITTVVVLGAGTFWFGEPQLKEYKEASKVRSSLSERMKMAQHLIDQKGDVEKDLDVFRKQLPQYPKEQNVTSELLQMLERTSQQHGVSLLRREPDEEKSIGDLFEVAINCSWEAELDGLVRFLYALQTQGAMVDIQQLTVTPMQGGGSRLKGNFTLNCAYTRATAAASGLGSVSVEPKPAP